MNRRSLLRLAGASLACMVGAAAFAAEVYPSRPIRLIVPSPAGSPVDVIARRLASALSDPLGVAVLVENKPGGGGVIAVASLLSPAEPDGHSFLVATDSVLVSPLLLKAAQYRPLEDLSYLVKVADAGMVLVANPNLPYRSVDALVQGMKRTGEEMDYGSWGGTGSPPVRVMASLGRQAGVAFKEIPYKGSPPAIQDVMAGQVPMTFTGAITAAPLIEGARLVPLGIVSDRRSALLPEVKTFSEMGYADPVFAEKAWVGVIAPGKLSAHRSERIQAAVLAAVRSEAFSTFLADIGFDVQAQPREQYTREASERYEQARKLFAELQIEPQ